MKKTNLLLLLSLVLVQACEPAYAATQRVLDGKLVEGLGDYTDYAINGGAERGKAGWSVSGTSSALTDLAIDTTNKYEGNAGFAWTPANADNYLSNAAWSISANQGLSGRDCAALVFTKTASTTHVLEAYDGTNVLASVSIPATTAFTPLVLNWQCSTSGSNRVRLNAGDTTIIYFDSLHWGDARGINVSQISQAVLYGSATWVGSTNCTWSTTSTSFGNFSADSDCTSPTGNSLVDNASAPATKVPGVTFSNLPPGEYLIVGEGDFEDQTSDTNGCQWRFSDGTNNTPPFQVYTAARSSFPVITGRFRYSNAQSNITFQVQARSDNAANTCALIANQANINELHFNVYRYPSSTEQSFRPDQTPSFWNGYSTGTWANSTTGGSFADPSTSTHTLTEVRNVNFGTVTATSNLPKITFTPLKAGMFWTCVSGKFFYNGTNLDIYGQLWNYTTSESIAEIYTRTGSDGSATASVTQIMCGVINATSTASITIGVRMHGGSTGATFAQASRGVDWNIINLSQLVSVPYLVGSVTSNSTGQERIERAYISNNGTCSVSTQSSTWISGISHPGTGQCNLTITGAFSAKPTCSCMSDVGANRVCSVAGPISNTTFSISTRIGVSNADEDGNFMVICMGPR